MLLKNGRIFISTLVFVCGTLLPAACLSRDFTEAEDSQPQAYGMGSDLDGSFVVYTNPAITAEGLTRYIEKRAKDYWKGRSNFTKSSSGALIGWPPTSLDHGVLARSIIATAKAFRIDAYVLAGLISKESSFTDKARSHTHAMGLTQFTQVAVQEMQIQLGAVRAAISPKQVASLQAMSQEALGALNEINPNQKLTFDALKASLARYTGGPSSRFRYLEEVLSPSYKTQLVLGASYLRVLYGSAKANKNGYDGNDTAEGYYRRALFSYNGDPNAQKVYQKEIIDMHVKNIKAAVAAAK